MTFIAPAVDVLSDHLQNPLTRTLMGVTFVFGLLRMRWYWVVVLALMVAISNILAEFGWSIAPHAMLRAGESGLIFFLANSALMFASYFTGYVLRRLYLLVSGEN